MKNNKILKIIGIIILIIIVLILVHTLRNYIILKNTQESFSKYKDSTNYSIKSIATEENGTVVTMKYYKKDNKQVLFIERNKNGEVSKITMYNNGERTDTFQDSKENKIVELDSKVDFDMHVLSYLNVGNSWQTLLISVPIRIKSTKYNEKDCYIIKNLPPAYSAAEEGAEMYIEKDTGLFVKNIHNGVTTEKEYTFDDVDDAIFIEPDISQYILKEK